MSEIDFNDYFYYDETSPGCLRWKIERRAGNNHNMVLIEKDSVAGSLCSYGGYWVVSLSYNKYQSHRIIWEMVNGEIPDGLYVDHIDRDKTNNKVENLRLVTVAVNSRNCKMWKTNTSGTTGVSFRAGKYPAWRAAWVDISGVKRDKHFSCRKFGEDALKLAIAYRNKMIEMLNSEGAGYSPKHGT